MENHSFHKNIEQMLNVVNINSNKKCYLGTESAY